MIKEEIKTVFTKNYRTFLSLTFIFCVPYLAWSLLSQATWSSGVIRTVSILVNMLVLMWALSMPFSLWFYRRGEKLSVCIRATIASYFLVVRYLSYLVIRLIGWVILVVVGFLLVLRIAASGNFADSLARVLVITMQLATSLAYIFVFYRLLFVPMILLEFSLDRRETLRHCREILHSNPEIRTSFVRWLAIPFVVLGIVRTVVLLNTGFGFIFSVLFIAMILMLNVYIVAAWNYLKTKDVELPPES